MLALNGKSIGVALLLGFVLGASIALVRWSGAPADRPAEPAAAVLPPERVVETVSVTNLTELVVTNSVTVTNVVELLPPPRVLSMRKTAPYRVVSGSLTPEMLREELAKSGVRVLVSAPASVALVEASDAMVAEVKGVAGLDLVEPLTPAEKISPGVLSAKPETAGKGLVPVLVPVVIRPMSSIDVGAIAKAVKDAGGEAVAEIVAGRPLVRATVAEQVVSELARRGDVRQIERDVK